VLKLEVFLHKAPRPPVPSSDVLVSLRSFLDNRMSLGFGVKYSIMAQLPLGDLSILYLISTIQ